MHAKHLTKTGRWSWLLAAACLMLPAQALAAKVAIVKIAGPAKAAGKARASLATGLAKLEGVQVASDKELASATKASKVKPLPRLTPAAAKKLAAAGKLTALLAGEVKQKGSKRVLQLRYYDADGRERLDGTYRLDAKGGVAPAALEAVALLLRAAPPSKSRPQQSTPKPSAPAQPAAAKLIEATAPAATPAAPEPQAAPVAVEVRPELDAPLEPSREAVAVLERAPVIAVEMLLGGLRRDYSLDGPASQVRYAMDGAAFASGVALELTPLAPLGSEASGVRLGAELLRGFLSSRLSGAEGLGSLSSPAWRWSVEAGYRHRLRPQSDYGATLGAAIGYGQWSFGGEELPEPTRTRHAALHLEASASQPVVPPFAALELAAALSPVGWLGNEQLAAYEDTGSTFGWELRAGLSGGMRRDGRGVRWGARLGYARFSDELGADDDPAEARESWLSFGGWLGFAY